MIESWKDTARRERTPPEIPGWEWREGLRVWWPVAEGLPGAHGGYVVDVEGHGTPGLVVAVLCESGVELFHAAEVRSLRVDTASAATGGVLLGMLPGVSTHYDASRPGYIVSCSNGVIRSMTTYVRPTLAEACVRMALHRGRWGAE